MTRRHIVADAMEAARPAPRKAAVAVLTGVLVLAMTAGGCGRTGGTGHRPTAGAAAGAATPAGELTVPPGGQPACARLYARLREVAAVISDSSELITSSLNKQQLSERIAAEQGQLGRAAEILRRSPVPELLAAADRHLVTALRAVSADFARAKGPAARGDLRAAVSAMRDETAVHQIVEASTTIEKACQAGGPAR